MRLWWNLVSCLVGLVLACWALYFIASRGPLPAGSAESFAGITFVISVLALGVGFLRIRNNPDSKSWSEPPTSRNIVYCWLAGGIVIPVLAYVINLGTTLLVAVLLVLMYQMGFAVDRIIEPVYWIGTGFSVICAIAGWWAMWKRYKASFTNDGDR